MKYGDTRYICEVFEDGDYFASVDAKTIDECVKEAEHYAAQCDGKVTMNYYESREIVNLI